MLFAGLVSIYKNENRSWEFSECQKKCDRPLEAQLNIKVECGNKMSCQSMQKLLF